MGHSTFIPNYRQWQAIYRWFTVSAGTFWLFFLINVSAVIAWSFLNALNEHTLGLILVIFTKKERKKKKNRTPQRANVKIAQLLGSTGFARDKFAHDISTRSPKVPVPFRVKSLYALKGNAAENAPFLVDQDLRVYCCACYPGRSRRLLDSKSLTFPSFCTRVIKKKADFFSNNFTAHCAQYKIHEYKTLRFPLSCMQN